MIRLLFLLFFIVSFSAVSKQRIIAMAPHIVEMLYEIGAGDNIVGTVDYADYPEAAKGIERIGGFHGIQIEKMLALKPDLVIAWQSGSQVSDLEQMQRLGINVVYSHPVKINDVATELRRYGKLTDNVEQAEVAATNFEKKLKNIKSLNEKASSIKVFYQLWPEPMMTINRNTWINQLIEICQGENVFADNPTDYPQISIENVLVTQAELIIIPDEKSDTPQPVINWQKWPELPAVTHNNFITVNADLLHRFAPRMLDGLDDMCQKFDQIRLKNKL